MKEFFRKFASWISEATGTVGAFMLAGIIVVGWLLLGPWLHYSDTWQLIISTVSSVVTFLMVFLIQYSQNKDTKALHLKLDELIRTNKEARNTFVNIEEKPDEVLDSEMREFDEMASDVEKNEDVR